MGNPSCAPCNPNPCDNIPIVQGSSGSFVRKLVALDPDGSRIPFDLTNATEIAASFPGSDGTPIIETLTGTEVEILGAKGAGIIQVNYSAQDSNLMRINPNAQQYQDLQIVVTLSGVAQVDTLSVPGSVTVGGIFTVMINGVLFKYVAEAGDTDLIVLTAILALIQSPSTPVLPIVAAVSGGIGSALLTITSLYPALGFSDVVSSTITKVLATANAGTRSVIIYPTILNISEPSYAGS